MLITIHPSGYILTPHVLEFVRQSIHRRLGGIGSKIKVVHVTLSEIKSSEHDSDNSCDVSLTMPGRPNLTTQVMHGSMYAAVERALNLARILTENGPRRRFSPAESMGGWLKT